MKSGLGPINSGRKPASLWAKRFSFGLKRKSNSIRNEKQLLLCARAREAGIIDRRAPESAKRESNEQFLSAGDLCRTHGISDATFYKWRSRWRSPKEMLEKLLTPSLRRRAVRWAISEKDYS